MRVGVSRRSSVCQEHVLYDTLETLCFVVILVALLLPVRRRLDISEMKIFAVPFEVPVLVWLFMFAV